MSGLRRRGLHELLIGEGHQVGAFLVKAALAEWKRRRREVFLPLYASSTPPTQAFLTTHVVIERWFCTIVVLIGSISSPPSCAVSSMRRTSVTR